MESLLIDDIISPDTRTGKALQKDTPVFLDAKAEAFWDKIKRQNKRELEKKTKPLSKEAQDFWNSLTPSKEKYIPKANKWTNIGRSLGQIGIGAVEMIPWNIVWEALKGLGKASQKGNFIESRFDDPDLNYDYFKKGSDQALSWLPTVSNAIDKLDQYTDLDLHPKNELEKVLRIAGSAGVNGQGLLNKVIQGATGAGIYETSKALGVPEVLSEILGVTGGNIIPQLAKGSIEKYPSGLTRRNLEKIQSSRKLTEDQKTKLIERLQKDGNHQAANILEKNNSFYNEYKNNPKIIEEAEKDMNLVSEYFSKHAPKTVSSDVLTDKLTNYMYKQKNASIGLDEGQRHYLSEMGKFIRESEKKGSFSSKQLLDQYRKNNYLYKQVINKEAGSLRNNAAQQVILDQNDAIKNVLLELYPHDAVMDKFLDSNKLYGNVKDTDKITSSIDKIFAEGNPTKNAEYLLRNRQFQDSIKKTYGSKALEDVNQLVKDIADVSKNLSLIKNMPQRSEFGFIGDFLIHKLFPPFTYSKYGTKLLMWFRNNILKNPKKYREWKKLVEAVKNKDVDSMKRYFKLLEPTFKAMVRIQKEEH